MVRKCVQANILQDICKKFEFERGSRDRNKSKETSSYIASHAA